MSSKVLNTSVSLDDLSASELNAAIDDTNFPGSKCPGSVAAAAAAAAAAAEAASVTNGVVALASPGTGRMLIGKTIRQNGDGHEPAVPEEGSDEGGSEDLDAQTDGITAGMANHNLGNGSAGVSSSFRNHNLSLKIKANPENGSTVHMTPWTPRTSTTPG